MSRVIFAETEKHALAMRSWLKLDPTIWHVNVYGGRLKGVYESAVLVRPLSGPSLEHFLWVSKVLAPKVFDPSKIIPLHWFYEEMASNQIQFDWPENQLPYHGS